MSPFIVRKEAPIFSEVAGYIHKSMIAIAVGKNVRNGAPNIIGSGFAADISEYFVTCWHVIEVHDELSKLSTEELRNRNLSDNILRIAFSTPDGFKWKEMEKYTWLRATVKGHDICVLRFLGIALPPLALREQSYVFGQDVGIMGFPLGSDIQNKEIAPLVLRTIISSSGGIPVISQGKEISQRIGLGSSVAGGFSGGPIFSIEDGQVIGIIASKLMEGDHESIWPAGISLGVPSSIIKPILQQSAIQLASTTKEAVKAFLASKETKQ